METGKEARWDEAFVKEQYPYAVWLSGIDKLSGRDREKLFFACGSVREVYRAKRGRLEQILRGEKLEALIKAQGQDAEGACEALGKKGIRYVPLFHPAYPKKLYEIADRPFGVYVLGSLPADERKCVAIVGARECSGYGSAVAEYFARELALAGIQVVSGMARGVDGIAQEAALAAGGDTYAVLGCGADVCYPASNTDLYRRVQEQGGVISEYPPGAQPLPWRFPLRNRIISGLSDAVLVVEAREKSGTLITVDMALEQGREVYAVPGRITDKLSAGCNSLICQGAVMALTPARLLEELCGGLPAGGGKAGQEKGAAKRSPDGITKEQRELLSLLDVCPVTLDQLRLKMQQNERLRDWTLQETMEQLMLLMLGGHIDSRAGCYFRPEEIPH